MGVRLNKVLSELNIGLQTAVDFLKKKSDLGEVKDDATPNTKISDEQYDALVNEFSTDKAVKTQAEQLFTKKPKEKKVEKPAVPEKAVTKTEELLEQRPQFKPLGKIDLNSVGKPKAASERVAEAKDPEPVVAAEPQVVETPEEEPVVAPVVDEPQEKSEPESVVEPQQEAVADNDDEAEEEPEDDGPELAIFNQKNQYSTFNLHSLLPCAVPPMPRSLSASTQTTPSGSFSSLSGWLPTPLATRGTGCDPRTTDRRGR